MPIYNRSTENITSQQSSSSSTDRTSA
jgi:hypothetical protein